MPYNVKIFKTKANSEYSLAAGKECAAITIDFLTQEHNKLRYFLERDEIVETFKTYVNLKTEDPNKIKVKEILDKQFDTLAVRIKAYCYSCLGGLQEKPDVKKTPPTPFNHLRNLYAEINSKEPLIFCFLENYELLKLEVGRLTNNQKVQKLEAAIKNANTTTNNTEVRRYPCTIV